MGNHMMELTQKTKKLFIDSSFECDSKVIKKILKILILFLLDPTSFIKFPIKTTTCAKHHA